MTRKKRCQRRSLWAGRDFSRLFPEVQSDIGFIVSPSGGECRMRSAGVHDHACLISHLHCCGSWPICRFTTLIRQLLGRSCSAASFRPQHFLSSTQQLCNSLGGYLCISTLHQCDRESGCEDMFALPKQEHISCGAGLILERGTNHQMLGSQKNRLRESDARTVRSGL